jgi:DmsE family decaheme c-type cytochrome
VIDGASHVGQDTCFDCHDDKEQGLARGIHGRLADFEMMGGQKSCESCHGPGSLHVDGEYDSGSILRLAELAPEETAAVCSKCHAGGNLIDWTHSEHALADLSCTDCHSIHAEKIQKASLKQEDPELCYSCHQEMMAKSNYPSRHPIREGKMSCEDCHNPHGELVTDERTNDLCLTCHSRYQGPFVFAHAPVEEDCTICHDAHGSVANNMLVQNEPFLCLQCHEGHFHLLRKGFDPATDPLSTPGTRVTPNLPGGVPPGAVNPATVSAANPHGVEGFQKSFGTKCTTCHQVIHGSDFPSQPLTGGGLTR